MEYSLDNVALRNNAVLYQCWPVKAYSAEFYLSEAAAPVGLYKGTARLLNC